MACLADLIVCGEAVSPLVHFSVCLFVSLLIRDAGSLPVSRLGSRLDPIGGKRGVTDEESDCDQEYTCSMQCFFHSPPLLLGMISITMIS